MDFPNGPHCYKNDYRLTMEVKSPWHGRLFVPRALSNGHRVHPASAIVSRLDSGNDFDPFETIFRSGLTQQEEAAAAR